MSKTIVNLKGLERQIANIKKIDMYKVGNKALELNEDQIAQKKNKDGSGFKPYSANYAKRKQVGLNDVDLVSKASGLSRNGKSRPHGTMLKNYNILRLQRYRVTLGFSSVWDRQKAAWITTGGRARPFVGLTKTNRSRLNKFAYKLITKGTY